MDRDEIRAIVHETLHEILEEKDKDNKTIIQRQVEDIAVMTLGKTVRRFWWAIISLVVTMVVGWTTLQLQVMSHDEELHSGNFYTLERGTAFETLVTATLEAREDACDKRHTETNRRLDSIETGVNQINTYLLNNR